MLVKAIIARYAVAPDERMTYWLPVHFGIPMSRHRRDIDVTSARLHLWSKLLKRIESYVTEISVYYIVCDI